MFGYIKPDKSELKIKEFELYKSVYCGLCRAMKKRTSNLSCATLSYDMVFLAVVRLALSGEEYAIKHGRCLPHPLRKRRRLVSSGDTLSYCAAASAVLVYYNLWDDIVDSNRKIKAVPKRLALPFSKRFRKKAALPQDFEEYIKDKLLLMHSLEKAGCENLSEISDVFGNVLAHIFSYGLDGKNRQLAYEIGFHTGKWIYIVDAVDDYESDIKSGSYNPLIFAYKGEKNAVANHKNEISKALILEREHIEGAVNLIDFSKRPEFKAIIYNIIYCGMQSTATQIFCKEERKNDERSL